MTDPDLTTRTEGEGETIDIPEGMKGFISGQVLGERYQILEMLGRGGMGEVWHAFDLKLRVEVALKALRQEFFKSDRRLELLRQEVRAAREVVSPNVCRIFDLIEVEGRELVSMEYVDGATLLGVLQERGPLELKEAQDIASQFLAGLEAIHRAGLIHRDIKPENIMLTRAGRVVVMDFGLARQETEGGGTVAGTPAYMAPEQAAGQTLDARADVYAAGVVLAEMVSPEGIKSFESRQSVWEGVRSEPAKLPDTPWAQVIQRAVKKDRECRYNSAHTLTRALEDVTMRVEGADDLHPYPGLASFTEADAEYFFGREAEVEQMWRKLEGPPRMLAIIGPSGAGKSSFIAAGLAANAPTTWGILRSTPGNAAISSLAAVVAREMAGDPDAVELLPRFGDADVAVELISRWAGRNSHSLLVVDQFEELFTQNTSDEQRRFADLLRRFVIEGNIHVLLSMRDDFAASCNAHESLRPIFQDLTVLDPPSGANLRRAIVQPATKCGYRFEDDDLVDEMLAEVEDERGALPLLAFAAAQLWQRRDKDTGLLTREAYQEIGGVGGALAQHAEVTIDRIGVERIPIVRELFRNLVTAEGTRAVREWDELLSIFSDSQGESPAAVLRALIDARLLTSYEIHEDEHKPTRRVEIIHESLLANWPRLVRWQTQDQEGAQLRDELRQAARAWDEHDRHNDRLWTGTAYREFELWMERYPGGLTKNEEAFARAMTSLATRRKRRRQLILGVAVTVLLIVLGVVTALWRKSVLQTRRAEAQKLIALGQLELDGYPTAALAHAIASLEESDTPEARRLALDALWKGPAAFIASDVGAWEASFTPDGRWLVQARLGTKGDDGKLGRFAVDGSDTVLKGAHAEAAYINLKTGFDSGHFVSYGSGRDATWEHVLWGLENGRRLASITYQEPAATMDIAEDADRERVVFLVIEEGRGVVDTVGYDGSVHRLGVLGFRMPSAREWGLNTSLDPLSGRWLVALVDGEVVQIDIGDDRLSEPRAVGRIDDTASQVLLDPRGRFVVTAHGAGEIRITSLSGRFQSTLVRGPPEVRSLWATGDGLLLGAVDDEGRDWTWDVAGDTPRFLRRFDPDSGYGWKSDAARGQVTSIGPGLKYRVWSMDAPVDAEPTVLTRGDVEQINSSSFSPNGRWLATADNRGLSFWPLTQHFPLVLRSHKGPVNGLVFAPDGRWLASSSNDGTLRLWPLSGEPLARARTLMTLDRTVLGLAVSPDGDRILAGTMARGNRLLRTDGGESKTFEGFTEMTWGVALSPDGRLAAATGGNWLPHERVIRVWEVDSGKEVRVIDVGENMGYFLQFTTDGHLLARTPTGMYRFDLTAGSRELLHAGPVGAFAASADGRRILMSERTEHDQHHATAVLLDVDSGAVTTLEQFGDDVAVVACDFDNDVAITGHLNGDIRVGSVSGGDTHLLLGNEGEVFALEVDPLGRWIASGSEDTTIRLWPMPDLSKPPLHTLPHKELIAKLKTLTNLRVAHDDESSTGWALTHDPFPGWETVPTW